MALYKNYYHLFPLYHFSRHPTHIPRVLRFKPPLSSRSKHLTVQRPWPHHQSYDLDNKTAKWPRHPKSCDQDTVVISRMSTILAYVGFRVFARQFLLFVKLLFLLGKGYISEEYHLFLRGGERHFNFHSTSFFVSMIHIVWTPATHCSLFRKLSPVCTFWELFHPQHSGHTDTELSEVMCIFSFFTH